MSLTPTPGDQCTQQLAEVNPISLRSTAAPIDLHARRVDDETVDAMPLQEACEPKSVIARLVAEYDRRLLATHLRPAITCRDELCHQTFAVAAFDRIDARLLMIGKLDTQEPRSCSTPRRRRAYPQELWLLDPFAGISFTSNNDLDEGDCWKTTAAFVRLIASFGIPCASGNQRYCDGPPGPASPILLVEVLASHASVPAFKPPGGRMTPVCWPTGGGSVQ